MNGADEFDSGEDGHGEEDDPFAADGPRYEVGYGRPPPAHRFKKGNRAAAGKCKRKLPKGIDHLLRQLAGEQIDVLVKGKRVRMTRREALLRQAFERAMRSSKDAASLIQLLRLVDGDPAFQVEPQTITIEFVGKRPAGLPGAPADMEQQGEPAPARPLPLPRQPR